MSARAPKDKPIPMEVVLKEQVAQLEKQLFVEQQLARSANRLANDKTTLAGRLEERLKKAQADISALKGELAVANEEIARQRGYLQRIYEDDIVRELGPTAHDQQLMPPRPRRQQPMNTPAAHSTERIGYSSNPKPTSWWDR